MSSLTSLSVNKNSTRFAPKVKARPARRPAPQRLAVNGSEPLEDETASPSEPKTIQDTPSFPPKEDPAAAVTSPSNLHPPTSSIPSIISALQEPDEPQPTSTRVRRRRSTAIVPRKQSQSTIPSLDPVGSENNTPNPRNISLDNFADEESVEEKTALKAAKKKGRLISLPSSSRNAAENITSTLSRSDDEYDSDEQPKAKRGKRTRKSQRQQQLDLETMKTLDEIEGDPAKEEYMAQPVSYFIKDLGEGVVSRLFKESERERLSGDTKGKKASKKLVEEDTEKENSEPKQEKPEERQVNKAATLIESSHAAQVRLVNGEIVLDADSLQVEREQQRPDVDFESMEVVEENAMSRKVSSNTWGKRQRSARWSTAETELFYDALAQFGTDFEMMAKLIPGRTRAQVRLKFNREEKLNSTKVDDYLIRKKKPVDLQKYEEATGIGLEEVPADFHQAQPI